MEPEWWTDVREELEYPCVLCGRAGRPDLIKRIADEMRKSRQDAKATEHTRVLALIQWCREQGETDLRQLRAMVESGDDAPVGEETGT